MDTTRVTEKKYRTNLEEIVLTKPVMRETHQVRTIQLDFGDLDRHKLVSAERKYHTSGGPCIAVKAVADEYCEYLAAEIANQPHELITRLCAADYLALTTAVRSYFLGTPLPGQD